MSIRQFIPNLLTLGNLFFGCLAILFAADPNTQVLGLPISFVFIAASLLCDFFDGFAARLLNVSSAIGKELDSLADVVSFGIAPAFLFYHALQNLSVGPIAYLAFLIPLFSAYRLAAFNVDEEQSVNFRGLPTPAYALFLVSLVAALYLLATKLDHSTFAFQPNVFIGIALVFAALMVSRLPLFGLKFKSFEFKTNWYRYFILLLGVGLVIALKELAFLFIIPLYMILSIIAKHQFIDD